MKKIDFKLWTLIIGLFLSFSLVACSEDEKKDEEIPNEIMTITDVAASDANLSILVEALQKAELDDDLANANGAFTVFAPTNAAFVDLLTELNLSSLNDVPKDVLTAVLLYHVVSGKKMANMVETGYCSSLSTGPSEGYGLSFYVDMSTAMINNRAKIVQTDVAADNGVIHVIDKVMLPMSITDHALANPAFSSLAAVVVKAGLADALDDDEGNYTVFAPVNEAFGDLLTNLNTTLDNLSAETLAPIVLYHAIDGFVPASSVSSGYFPTLSIAFERPMSLKIDVDGNVMLNKTTKVVATDVVATNGIIHAIDEVLLPPTVVDVALDNSNFSILVEAVVKAELVEALSNEGPFTVFAPTNAAFESLFQTLNVSGVADLTKETLIPILLAHVVSANAASNGLNNGSVPTLNDQKSLAINVTGGVTIDGDINVIATDIQAKNGIVHVIDKVIIP